MKVSRYNFIFPYEHEEGQHIIYNTLSNSMGLIDDEMYKKYLDFEQNNIPIDDKNLLNDLINGSFILESDIDELNIIKYNIMSSRFNTSHFGLTIAPTLDCNFRCIYCYEKEAINKCYMSKETEDNIVKLLEGKSKSINSFSVTWYGGEPTLAIDTIDSLSQRFIEICEKNNIKYTASIVTNGYNLTKKNLDILKKSKVSVMQITLDGNEKTHDARRHLVGNLPTFNRIISNLVELKDELISTSLRINVDSTNYKDAIDVVDILEQNDLKKSITPYIARVDSPNGCYDDDICLPVNEFYQMKVGFDKEIIKRGFGYDRLHNYPYKRGAFCGADRKNTYVINADGRLYKCWNEVGLEELSFGNVNNLEGVELNDYYFDYLLYDVTQDDDCRNCKYLPICIGGCPFARKNKSAMRCTENKHIMDKNLLSVAKYLIEENFDHAINV